MIDSLTPAALPTTGVVASAPVPAPVSGVEAVAAIVTNAPGTVATTTRQIQITGLIAELPSGNTIVINTPTGQVTLTLGALASDQQQHLTQQLISIFQNQRPISAVIQPGSQPPQAVILLPQSALASSSGQPQPAGLIVPPALAAGDVLTAIVLPPATPAATPTALQPSPVPTNLTPPTQPTGNNPSPLAQPVSNTVTATPTASPANSANPPTAAAPQIPTPIQTGLNETILLPSAAAAYAHTEELVPTHLSILPTRIDPTATPTSSVGGTSPAPEARSVAPSLALQPGQPVNLRIDAVLESNSTLPNLQPNQLVATLVSKGINGEITLQAGTTQFFVRQATDTPVGTVFVVTASKPDAVSAPTIADHSPLAGLQQLLAAMAQIDPALAKQIAASVIPQPNAQLPGTLLFFMNALKQGDFQGWLGAQTVNRLTAAGKQNLIARLVQDIKAATHPTRDAVVGEWTSYPIPMRHDHIMNMMTLYVHSDPRDNADPTESTGAKASKVRFVIDVMMSRIGSLQLDGLSRPRHLDMIIRSERALPGYLPNELRAIYTQTLEAMGYSGSILFQPGRRGWVVMQGKETSREI